MAPKPLPPAPAGSAAAGCGLDEKCDPPMNQLAAGLLIGSFIAWCFALAFRGEKWAFAGWFPFTAASACGTLAWLSVIPQLGNSGGGAAGGFAALGSAIAFFYLASSPVLLVVAIRLRPQRLSPAIVVPTMLLVFVGVPVLWGLASYSDKVPVHLNFKTTDGSAIPNAQSPMKRGFLITASPENRSAAASALTRKVMRPFTPEDPMKLISNSNVRALPLRA